MGCSSSTQTTALETTRPNTKHEGSTSAGNENGCSGEEIQSSAAATAHCEAGAASAETPDEATTDQPEDTETTSADPTEEPAPTENPAEEAPASIESS